METNSDMDVVPATTVDRRIAAASADNTGVDGVVVVVEDLDMSRVSKAAVILLGLVNQMYGAPELQLPRKLNGKRNQWSRKKTRKSPILDCQDRWRQRRIQL